MYYMPFFYGSYLRVTVLGVTISGWASMSVNSIFNRYDQVQNQGNYIGKVATRHILGQAGLYEVGIREVAGNLIGNYNPTDKVLSPSQSVCNPSSIATVGTAAREVEHALRDASNYVPVRMRSTLVPIISFDPNLSVSPTLLGLVSGMNQALIKIGVWCPVLIPLFQVVTLPVKFNASHRALRMLNSGATLSPQEMPVACKVLFTVTLTYVAAILASTLRLFRPLPIFGERNNDNS